MTVLFSKLWSSDRRDIRAAGPAFNCPWLEVGLEVLPPLRGWPPGPWSAVRRLGGGHTTALDAVPGPWVSGPWDSDTNPGVSADPQKTTLTLDTSCTLGVPGPSCFWPTGYVFWGSHHPFPNCCPDDHRVRSGRARAGPPAPSANLDAHLSFQCLEFLLGICYKHTIEQLVTWLNPISAPYPSLEVTRFKVLAL